MEPRYPSDAPEQKLMLLDFLDARRRDVLSQVADLPEDVRTSSCLPSGWTPLGMLTHLVFMERRWFVWGFAALPVRDPQGDRGPNRRFQVPQGWGYPELSGLFDAQASRTREIVEAASLSDRAALGGWFATAEEAPTLGWILLHVLGEYAQHSGHLDVFVEIVKDFDGR
ncbi:MAG: mycothiol transferase [Propionibacteriaceae bacterium]